MTKNQWQMILTSHGTIDRMSEEVYSETYTLPTDAADQFFESDLTDLLENPDLPNFNVAGECDPSALLGK